MAKMKVHELAKELEIQSKEVLAFLQEKGFEVKAAQSSVEDEQIAILLKSAKTPEKIGKKLIETANRNGGKDNIAVIVIHLNSGEV